MKVERVKKVENLFLILCLFWGFVFIIFNPPFQSPDEASHFYKVYGYEQGSFNYKKITVIYKDKKLKFQGQILPAGVVQTVANADKFDSLSEQKTSFNKTARMFSIPLEKDKKIFVGCPMPSYSPFSYILMIPSVWILSLFNASPLLMMYVCRICSLCVYCLLTYFAIKITPVKKYFFLAVGLIPCAIFFGSIIGTDGITNGLAFLLFAYLLKLVYGRNIDVISKKRIGIFYALIFLVILCKFAYAPLVLTYLLIPTKRFENLKFKLKSFMLILVLCSVEIAAIVGWNLYLGRGLTSFASILDSRELFWRAVLHPVEYLGLIFKTTIIFGRNWLSESILSFGRGPVILPFGGIIWGWLTIFLCSAFNLREDTLQISFKDRLIAALSSILCIFFTLSICYLLFTADYSQKIIENFQGRYLLPLMPVFLFIFSNKYMNFKTKVFDCFVLFFTNFVLVLSLIKLVERFY